VGLLDALRREPTPVDLVLRPAAPGTLPPDGEAVVGGVALPAGAGRAVEILPPEGPAIPGGMWVTSRPLADAAPAWRRLHAAYPSTGLWPVAVWPGLETHHLDVDELDPLIEQDIARADPGAVLRDAWLRASAEDDDEIVRRYGGTFPGLAPPGTERAANPLADRKRVRDRAIGLIPVGRPADAVAVPGMLDIHDDDIPPAHLVAVMRSWEERFGAVPVGLDFGAVEVAVERPPVTPEHAERLAIEHHALFPFGIRLIEETLASYAKSLAGSTSWHLLWER
jgi:hypothetical protein